MDVIRFGVTDWLGFVAPAWICAPPSVAAAVTMAATMGPTIAIQASLVARGDFSEELSDSLLTRA